MSTQQLPSLRSPLRLFWPLFSLLLASSFAAALALPQPAGTATRFSKRDIRPPQAAYTHDYLDDISDEGLFWWAPESMPVRVYIEPGDDVDGYRSNYPAILSNCFDEWVKASGNRLSWAQVERKQDANIVVSFTADAPERSEGTEAGRTRTYTRFNTESNTGIIYKATMALATRLPDREMSDEEVKKTFLHEVGHAFGLAGHSPYRSDIMFARVSRSQAPFLSQRDRSTIVRLYGQYPAVANRRYTTRTVDLGVQSLNKTSTEQNTSGGSASP
ncbi:MAG TPA: matrixin family metalloprotease [Candidatus Obscuribacterales bacterium]